MEALSAKEVKWMKSLENSQGISEIGVGSTWGSFPVFKPRERVLRSLLAEFKEEVWAF